MNAEFEQITKFHGHTCPGITIGYRMAKAGMNFLADSRAKDEEIVAIVENDACGVDAVQCLTGCTFGKGNFIFKDYGKQVYTFYSRNTGKGVRVVFKGGGMPGPMRKNRQEMIDWLLSVDEKEIIDMKEVVIKEPERAQMNPTVKCEFCGELVMETRTEKIDGKYACIPCVQRIGTRQ